MSQLCPRCKFKIARLSNNCPNCGYPLVLRSPYTKSGPSYLEPRPKSRDDGSISGCYDGRELKDLFR